MALDGCPHCGAPYRRTVSTDEDTLGEIDLPEADFAGVCYNVRTGSEAYFGFTLYFHPATVYAIERHSKGEWRGERADIYASEATAHARRDRIERVEDVETRIREVPLTDVRRPPEDRPREPRL